MMNTKDGVDDLVRVRHGCIDIIICKGDFKGLDLSDETLLVRENDRK